MLGRKPNPRNFSGPPSIVGRVDYTNGHKCAVRSWNFECLEEQIVGYIERCMALYW